jgi:hypothetical protein
MGERPQSANPAPAPGAKQTLSDERINTTRIFMQKKVRRERLPTGQAPPGGVSPPAPAAAQATTKLWPLAPDPDDTTPF